MWYAVRYKWARLFIIGGAGYFLLDTINSGEVKEETLIISGSLITAGILAELLISKKIKIKGRRKIVILH